MQPGSNRIDLSELSCQSLSGVGQKVMQRLEKLGIRSVQDLLFHLPFRYQDRTRVSPIKDVMPGQHAVLEAEIVKISLPRGGRTRLLLQLQDGTATLHLRFFYVNKAQIKSLIEGVKLRCFGEVRLGTSGKEMIHPEYQILTTESLITPEKHLTPIYPATEGLSQLMLLKMTNQALRLLETSGTLKELLPNDILQQFNYPSLSQALYFVHRPLSQTPIDLLEEKQHTSQKRLILEELLAHRLSLLRLKKTFQAQKAYSLKKNKILTNRLKDILSFQLTGAQERVIEEISVDLVSSFPMLRLLQGDVGSGKTAVAAFALLQAVANGYQAAVLAPTELLAEQHYRVFKTWFEPLNIQVDVLTGQVKTSVRKTVLNSIVTGQTQIVVGTHAIFQNQVKFPKLALIIVDEQHRFGVLQRALLREKGVYREFCPHQLVMTATPIPRTLAMSAYADLDYSVIDELPKGRSPIMTSVINNTRRDEIIDRIREVCQQGSQVYWVCTLIEESEVLQCKAAENTFSDLQAQLPLLKIALLHGKMKTLEKDRIMQQFKKGEVQLLVATTVVEVGVDVPNATLMVIENAERLGLAQLHQLRGRVGRGSKASYCLLLYQGPLSHLAKARLAIMRETTDGFRIAERDLTLRGPGEVLGTRQTGNVNLRIADLIRDEDLIHLVQQVTTHLIAKYPEYIDPIIARWLGSRENFGQV